MSARLIEPSNIMMRAKPMSSRPPRSGVRVQLKLIARAPSAGNMSAVLPLNAALSRLPFVHLSAEDVRRANHGREVAVAGYDWADGENVKMLDEHEQLIAIGRYDAGAKSLHPRVVLGGN